MPPDRNRCDFSLSTQRWRQFDDEPARVSLAVPSDSPFSHDSEGVTIGFHPASGPRAAIGKVMHVASCALMDSTMNRFLHVLQRVSRDCKDLASVLKEISIRKGDRGYMVNFRTAAPFEESEAVCVLPTQYLDVVLTELPSESGECLNPTTHVTSLLRLRRVHEQRAIDCAESPSDVDSQFCLKAHQSFVPQ